MYIRSIEKEVDKWLSGREILIIYGARQVGKTTFLSQLLKNKSNTLILNCEINEVYEVLQEKNLNRIRFLFGSNKIIALDEAQNIPEIGKVLKIIYDELPEYKLIVTGSSSFELSSHITEALTGRNIKFTMFPLTLHELNLMHGGLALQQKLDELLVYGSYPGLVDLESEKKQKKLTELSSDYLFKDILSLGNIRNPDVLRKLIRSLSYQIGSQVSINELSNNLGISRSVVENYIDVLKKSFVLFELKSFSSNLRNEIKKSSKYYFYDNGIRNAIINDLRYVSNRQDIGQLWENFCVAERVKHLLSNSFTGDFYFWRTYDGAEIDLLEVNNNIINCFEFKWNIKRKTSIPKSFNQKHHPNSFKIISKENFFELMG